MRRFALGALGYTPERFGAMLVADFLDAYTGYSEAENEKTEAIAELIRTSTWLLWNIQVGPGDKAATAHELWPFAWDKETPGIIMSTEERKEIEDFQADIIKDF
jgi:hypothetical protein